MSATPAPHLPTSPLIGQLIIEATAMSQYALRKGLDVPAWVVRAVGAARGASEHACADDAAAPVARGRGDIKIEIDIDALVLAHRRLVRTVAPATPYMLAMMSARRHGDVLPRGLLIQLDLPALAAPGR
jgi:hypothetical protein